MVRLRHSMASAALGMLVLAHAAADELRAQNRINVVATLPTYAAIAREIAGDYADVSAIARGDEDPHFVTPRPSFAARMQRADMFIVTGLDLELCVPVLIDRANNRDIMEGAPGHVVAYAGVGLLEIPESVSRSGGDVHVYGNPHVHTDPVNAIIVAGNIAEGLIRIDPQHGDAYRIALESFSDRIMRHLFGDELVEMLGGETLFDLAHTYEFWSFAKEQRYKGKPLIDYVGGWLGEAAPFRGDDIVCYHKNWAYFTARFGLRCAMYVEPKPGIPPSPGHVGRVIEFIRSEEIPVLLAANYFSRTRVERVASRARVVAVIVPEHVGGEEGIDDYFTLVDTWVSRLFDAMRRRTQP